MNYVKTAMLLAVMTALVMGLGYMMGGAGGVVIALGVAVAMNAMAYWNADKMVLRMHGARQVDETSAPDFVRLVHGLAAGAGMPPPKVFIMDTDQPNAFATGRNPEHAAVAATKGLLRRLSREELAGVMAHELAHVKNRDTLIMTITATFAGALSMLASFGFLFGGRRNNPLGMIGVLVMMVVAPLAAGLVQMAISRTREYQADRLGAQICGHPLWLASALEKIHNFAAGIDNPAAEKNPATAHMFIINPLHGQGADKLFSTHPNTANRIAVLREMANEMSGGMRGQKTRPENTPSGPPSGPWG